jgi:chemotaxis protein MotB
MKRFLLALALGAAAAAACGIPEEQYNARVADLDRTKAALDKARKEHEKTSGDFEAKLKQLDQQNVAMKNRLEALGQDLSKVQTERQTTEQELDTARKRMEELKKSTQQAEIRISQFRGLLSRFKEMINTGKLQVEVREGRMLVKLPDNILFDPGKTALKPEGKDAIRQVAAVLKDVQNRNFQVAGHTDNVPIKSTKFASNWELSSARALEVVRLMTDEGLDARRVSAAGYADTQPVAPNDTPPGREKNRRIEIVLQPNVEDLPPIEEALKETPTAGHPGEPPAPATGSPPAPAIPPK